MSLYIILNEAWFVKREQCPECVEPDAYVEVREMRLQDTGLIRFSATIRCFADCDARAESEAGTAFDAIRGVIRKYREGASDDFDTDS